MKNAFIEKNGSVTNKYVKRDHHLIKKGRGKRRTRVETTNE
jgi:hypothetical protein